MIVVPGLDGGVVHAGLLEDLGVVPHDAGADVVVDAVVLAVLGVVVEAAHDQVVLDGLHDVVELGQLDVALEVVGEHVDLDVHDVGRAFAGLQGDGQLVVHILIGIDLHVDVQLGVVGIRIPLLQHLLVELGVELLEGPEGQVNRFFLRERAEHAEHHQRGQQNSQQFLHGICLLLSVGIILNFL